MCLFSLVSPGTSRPPIDLLWTNLICPPNVRCPTVFFFDDVFFTKIRDEIDDVALLEFPMRNLLLVVYIIVNTTPDQVSSLPSGALSFSLSFL